MCSTSSKSLVVTNIDGRSAMRRFIETVATSLLILSGCVDLKPDEQPSVTRDSSVTDDVSMLHDGSKDDTYDASFDASEAEAVAGDTISDVDHSDGRSDADGARDVDDAGEPRDAAMDRSIADEPDASDDVRDAP